MREWRHQASLCPEQVHPLGAADEHSATPRLCWGQLPKLRRVYAERVRGCTSTSRRGSAPSYGPPQRLSRLVTL